MAKKKMKRKAKKKAKKAAKKSFLTVRSELVKALDKAKEKYGTDGNISKKLGLSKNYVSNLRYDINKGNATYDRMVSVKKDVLGVMKPKETIDLSKTIERMKNRHAEVKKVAKKVATAFARDAKKAKKVVKKAKKKATESVGPFFTPIKIELKEEMVVRVGSMTFTTEVVAGEAVDVIITRGKTKILARI